MGPAGSARRTILKEKDRPAGINIGLHRPGNALLLDHGDHAIIDGILYADRYEPMLARLSHEHRGRSCFFYLDVSLDETFRRHATRPQAAEFRLAEMRDWYRPRDLLTSVREQVIPQTSDLEQTIDTIVTRSQLTANRGRHTGNDRRKHRSHPRFRRLPAGGCPHPDQCRSVHRPSRRLSHSGTDEAGEVAGKVNKIFRDHGGVHHRRRPGCPRPGTR